MEFFSDIEGNETRRVELEELLDAANHCDNLIRYKLGDPRVSEEQYKQALSCVNDPAHILHHHIRELQQRPAMFQVLNGKKIMEKEVK